MRVHFLVNLAYKANMQIYKGYARIRIDQRKSFENRSPAPFIFFENLEPDRAEIEEGVTDLVLKLLADLQHGR